MSNTELLVLKGGINKASIDYLLKVPYFIFTQNKNCRAQLLYVSITSSVSIKKNYKRKDRRKATETTKVTFLLSDLKTHFTTTKCQ